MKNTKSETRFQKAVGIYSAILTSEDMLMIRGGNDDPEPPVIRVKP